LRLDVKQPIHSKSIKIHALEFPRINVID